MAVVTGVLREGTQVSIRARDFTWLGDEPAGAGGTAATRLKLHFILERALTRDQVRVSATSKSGRWL